MLNFHQQTNIPKEFIYPKEELIQAQEELNELVIDLRGIFTGNNSVATQHVAMLVKTACLNHGFFQVINHGVDSQLINMAHAHVNDFFKLPLGVKLKVQKQHGSLWGYSSAHAERFNSRLPWKETLSFNFHENSGSNQSVVVDFFESGFGKEFEQMGLVFERYCKEMKRLGLVIMEILGISLGVEKSYYKEFFRDANSIMRCNFYPTCQDPDLALGTAPHCDPNSLTILHQDQVGGLEVFVDSKWKSVRPRPDALVINIGDTFTALSNGLYKSCVHRAIVNRQLDRISLAFFFCPREDKIIVPPQDLVSGPRMYPDFTWFDLLNFTQNHYRADQATLQNFTLWFLSSKFNNPT
ncbi:gibberellin 20 oxidase 2-like [Lycium ferocissimum]|uniref:gibberellin 20 oxidase 2-like n=1 Tax=Lycium ferocissimum TaxID=112874 RepID=UPI002814E496|nr:gibberellin 20 oxidase 2-like [Lycium ferocissimum]